MKLNIKNIAKKTILSACAITMLSSSTTFALKNVGFTNSYVDSNQWSSVIQRCKSDASTYTKVYIAKIKKADGKASNYKKVNGVIMTYKEGKNYYASSSIKCELKETTQFDIDKKYQAKGTSVSFCAKGNDPSLDCRIDGEFSY